MDIVPQIGLAGGLGLLWVYVVDVQCDMLPFKGGWFFRRPMSVPMDLSRRSVQTVPLASDPSFGERGV